MAMTNRERVGKGLDLLREGLAPFVEREVKTALEKGALNPEKLRTFLEDGLLKDKPILKWDSAALLKLMWETWNEVFRDTLGQTERSLVSEIRDWRNKWAHQEPFSSDDAYRALDSMERLLSAVSAPQEDEVRRLKLELMRQVFDEQVRQEKRKAGGSLVEAASGTLRPWREIITPHPDVASGRYQQAEFAADLWQVHLGEGSDEYRDPVEFFRRTYLTEGLKGLLVNALRRLSGQGGDPVVQLQTNFGGGKTHSMLALYHLFSGRKPSELPGVEALLAEAEVTELPQVRRVVLVGNKISPGNPVTKPDGTVVRTLWGELAYQLGGKEAYAVIAEDDKNATSPGDRLRELFVRYGPCLILIDEWVAYARQLHDTGDLPGGSFETQFSFAQALTESAKLAPNCLLVVSLPASDARSEDVEVGGLRGREALERLRNVVGRLESSWRPASPEESFEIVRRRLFQPIADPEAYKHRDTTARAFADLYRAHAAEFPPECATSDYEERIKRAFPIHPEIFDRLYQDWSSLVKFQRTRGVLRLMAAVVHVLWEKGDKNPLILPSTIPLDDPRVQSELTRHLPDNWAPIISRDVDGENALPLRIDAEVPNLGKFQAARRVARTIFLGSAPKVGAAHRGLEDRRIKLGCAMPGESPAVFGDALRRLAAQATYLYQDGTHFWYDTQPTVTKLAEDRAGALRREPDKVFEELERRLREAFRERGPFAKVHLFPRTGADVPDDLEARLVVLSPEYLHTREGESKALLAARELLEKRGNAPRLYRNTLVFLAADGPRWQDLEEAIRFYLAWRSILEEKEVLNLTPFQVRQAETQLKAAEGTVNARIPEAYAWLLVPEQKTPSDPITWQALRLTGNDALAVRAGKKLKNEDRLATALAPTILRKYLDDVPLWRGNHVAIRQLVEDFATYPYLPRLEGPHVLAQAIQKGLSLRTWQAETFAYADAYDEATGQYRGLRGGQALFLTPDDPGLLVRPEVARDQLEREKVVIPPPPPPPTPPEGGGSPGVSGGVTSPPPSPKKVRFYGVASLNPMRVGPDAAKIAEEIIAHLLTQGARVEVTLEIKAHAPQGFSEHTVRVLAENSRALRFNQANFEEEGA
ncbi:Swt1 family HEPN domain-containing protein [Thermus oshimai]